MMKMGKVVLASSLMFGGFTAVVNPASAALNDVSLTSVVGEKADSLKVINGGELVKEKKLSSPLKSIDQLDKTYELKDIDMKDVKAGTTVFNFETKEELQKFLEEVEKAPNKIEKKFKAEKGLPVSTTNNKSLSSNAVSLASSTSVVRRTASENTGFAQVNLYADIKVYSSGSFRQISSVSEWTSHTGVTFSLDWTQNYHDDYIASNKQSVRVVGGGTLDYVVFYEGIGKLYSRDIDLSLTYSL